MPEEIGSVGRSVGRSVGALLYNWNQRGREREEGSSHELRLAACLASVSDALNCDFLLGEEKKKEERAG